MSQYAVTNPATGEVVETFDGATDQQIQDAIAASKEAYADWSTQTFSSVSYTHLTLPTNREV